MKPNIFKSRRFWLAVLDAFFSILAIVLTAKLSPEHLTLAMQIIGYLQPVIIVLVVAYTVDDTVQTLRG